SRKHFVQRSARKAGAKRLAEYGSSGPPDGSVQAGIRGGRACSALPLARGSIEIRSARRAALQRRSAGTARRCPKCPHRFVLGGPARAAVSAVVVRNAGDPQGLDGSRVRVWGGLQQSATVSHRRVQREASVAIGDGGLFTICELTGWMRR